jgi:hypothetical protein
MRRARNWCREPDGFSSWPFEDEGGIGEFFSREAEGGAKEDLGRPAPGEGHEAHAFLEVAVAGEEFESRLVGRGGCSGGRRLSSARVSSGSSAR